MFQYYKPFNNQRGNLRSIDPHLQSFQQIGLFAKGVPLHVLFGLRDGTRYGFPILNNCVLQLCLYNGISLII